MECPSSHPSTVRSLYSANYLHGVRTARARRPMRPHSPALGVRTGRHTRTGQQGHPTPSNTARGPCGPVARGAHSPSAPWAPWAPLRPGGVRMHVWTGKAVPSGSSSSRMALSNKGSPAPGIPFPQPSGALACLLRGAACPVGKVKTLGGTPTAVPPFPLPPFPFHVPLSSRLPKGPAFCGCKRD